MHHLVLNILALILISLVSNVSMANVLATVTPPKGGEAASMYSLPGFRWSKENYCSKESKCEVVGTVHKISSQTLMPNKVQILDFVSVTGTLGRHAEGKFYKIRAETGNGMKEGWVHESYITPDLALPQCRQTQFRDWLTDTSAVIAAVERSQAQPSALPQLDPSLLIFNENCSKFINQDGEVGEWGTQLLSAMERVDADHISYYGKSCFYENMPLGRLCPKFKDLSDANKRRFWVYAFASIAQVESSCDPNRINKAGENGQADGLFQLEHSVSLRHRSERDPVFCKTRGETKTLNLAFQFECAPSIIRNRQCNVPCDRRHDMVCHYSFRGAKTYNSKGEHVGYVQTRAERECMAKSKTIKDRWCIDNRSDLSSRNSYFEELRPIDGKISSRIKEFPGCK